MFAEIETTPRYQNTPFANTILMTDKILGTARPPFKVERGGGDSLKKKPRRPFKESGRGKRGKRSAPLRAITPARLEREREKSFAGGSNEVSGKMRSGCKAKRSDLATRRSILQREHGARGRKIPPRERARRGTQRRVAVNKKPWGFLAFEPQRNKLRNDRREAKPKRRTATWGAHTENLITLQ